MVKGSGSVKFGTADVFSHDSDLGHFKANLVEKRTLQYLIDHMDVPYIFWYEYVKKRPRQTTGKSKKNKKK